jgi:hypothetical protein
VGVDVSEGAGWQARRWWRRPWVWGVGLSLVLGIASTLLDQDRTAVQVALVAVLAGTAVGLLVDQYVRFDDIREDLRSANTAGNDKILDALARANPIIRATHNCQVFAAGLADDWKRIEESRGHFHKKIFDELQKEFADKVHDLAEGRVDIDAESFYSFRRQPMEQFKEMYMVHARELTYWDTTPGRRYLNRQREAISAGRLMVERIFVVSGTDLDVARPIIERHLNAGITVSIVIREEVVGADRSHLVDLGVITDDNRRKILVRPRADADPDSAPTRQLEMISDKPGDIAVAESSIAVLQHNYAQAIADVYGTDSDRAVRLHVARLPDEDPGRRIG